MSRRTNRRQFLQATAAAGAGFWALGGVQPAARALAANDKLNVAFVGVGGMGGGNLDGGELVRPIRFMKLPLPACPRGGVAGCGENIVAVCDIDENTLNSAGERHKKAKRFTDYRKMLEECKDVDAVVVSTPDHSHAPAAVRALRMGKHVYCEKPLTYTVTEARLMKKLAAEKKVATCMGNRGTATDGFRRGVELLRAGVVGNVTEVHVWTNRPGKFWKQGMDRPKGEHKAPSHVQWDLWVGPAPERAYHPGLHPFAWRGWIDFGTGALGDMACHTANLAYMGLKLTQPTTVESVSSGTNGETYPLWSTTTYQFPARGTLPAVKLVWYDGVNGGKQNLPPEAIRGKLRLRDSGSLFIGERGILYSPSDYGDRQDILTREFEKLDYKTPEPSLPRAPGQNQYKDWLNACKGGRPALANFDYAAELTEFVLLGNVALRVGKKIEWDAAAGKVTNAPEAAKFIDREYRKGFEL
jgi:predicted dehydrogenase